MPLIPLLPHTNGLHSLALNGPIPLPYRAHSYLDTLAVILPSHRDHHPISLPPCQDPPLQCLLFLVSVHFRLGSVGDSPSPPALFPINCSRMDISIILEEIGWPLQPCALTPSALTGRARQNCLVVVSEAKGIFAPWSSTHLAL